MASKSSFSLTKHSLEKKKCIVNEKQILRLALMNRILIISFSKLVKQIE